MLYKNAERNSHNTTLSGFIAAALSALFVTGYMLVNKHVYDSYEISAIDYSLLFAIIGGIFGAITLIPELKVKGYSHLQPGFKQFIVLSFVSFLAVGLLVVGQNYTTAVNTALLATGSVLTTLLFSHFMLRESLTRGQLAWTVALFGGMYIGIVGFRSLHLNTGDIIVIASLFLFGFGNVFSRKVMKTYGSKIVPDIRLALSGVFALCVALPFFRSYTQLTDLLPWTLLAGLFYWLCMRTFAYAVHTISANEAIVINNGHVLSTGILSTLLLGETYSVEKLVGSVIILVSIFYIVRGKK